MNTLKKVKIQGGCNKKGSLWQKSEVSKFFTFCKKNNNYVDTMYTVRYSGVT